MSKKFDKSASRFRSFFSEGDTSPRADEQEPGGAGERRPEQAVLSTRERAPPAK
jgi:hypothetical protein